MRANPANVTTLAADTSSRDPETGLAAVAALRSLVDVLEALQVGQARTAGWTWKQIAERLGVSKQAVHQKYRGHAFGGPGGG
jgi:hypothetical protein